LGFVSLFMDISSEMIHSLLPVFLVTTLHASATTLGLIEGLAFSGPLLAVLIMTASGGDIRLVLAGRAGGVPRRGDPRCRRARTGARHSRQQNRPCT
jgi:hypothetical protein